MLLYIYIYIYSIACWTQRGSRIPHLKMIRTCCRFWYVSSAVGPTDKFIINIVLILIAERDSCAAEGHSSSYRKAIKATSSVEQGVKITLLTFVMGLLQHGLTYSHLMTVLSFVSISIHHHHNEQQDGKVIPLLVRLQTCFVPYTCTFLHKYTFLLSFIMYYCAKLIVPELLIFYKFTLCYHL